MEGADGQLPPAVIGLGDPVGVGRTAEVFARGEDAVIKVLRPGFADRVGESEARIAAIVADAAVAAPRFLGTTRVEGRFGLVFERVVGPSMLDRLSHHPAEIDRLARRFAELHIAMHQADGTGLPDQKAEMRRMIDRAGAGLPEAALRTAIGRLGDLPAGAAICHGDMHPGNVILAANGSVVIDWMTASCGNPAADVARTLFLLRHSGVPRYMPRVQRGLIALARRRFSSVYLRSYKSLRQLDLGEVGAWRLPILVARLGEGIEDERPAVLALIRQELERLSPFAGQSSGA